MITLDLGFNKEKKKINTFNPMLNPFNSEL